MAQTDNLLVPMGESDVAAAAALVARAMNADEGRWADRTMRFHFGCRRHNLDDGRMYFVSKRDDTVAGLVGLHHIMWGPERNVWLAWFAVDPDRQRRGLGGRLLAAVEKIAVREGYRKLLVETYAHEDFEKARRFYERGGFREVGRVDDYLDDGSAMLVYAKDIGPGRQKRRPSRGAGKSRKLTDLANIGAVLAGRLEEAGIETAADLKTLGSIEAVLRVRAGMDDDAPCANMLYALEGAIRGVRWHGIPEDERAELRRRYLARRKE